MGVPTEAEPVTYLVRDIMTRNLVTLGEDEDLSQADAVLQLARIRHLPVVRDDRLIGLVTHRDILRAVATKGQCPVPASEVMAKEVRTTRPDARLAHAAKQLLEQKIGCLPVVEEGKLVGLVTEADFVRFALRLIEDVDQGLEGLEAVRDSVVDTL